MSWGDMATVVGSAVELRSGLNRGAMMEIKEMVVAINFEIGSSARGGRNCGGGRGIG